MTVTEEQVREALRSVHDPEINRPIEEIGMLKGIHISSEGAVRVDVLLTVPGCPLKEEITRRVTDAVAPLDGVSAVEVNLGQMSEEQRSGLVTQLRGGRPEEQAFFTDGKTAVIAVASGKGGVGKSSVTVNLATALAAEGHPG
jgi:ATP-binding protein involved in chromosome partitioning